VQSIRILLEGRPGSGKTTLARRIVAGLRERDIPVTGFTTEEIREAGARVGFAIETVEGERGTLAHVDFAGPPRVGKYGVDLDELERLALPTLRVSDELVVIDELGKMELASERFRAAVDELFAVAGGRGRDGSYIPPSVHRRAEGASGCRAAPGDGDEPGRPRPRHRP
jgi:nucleoside-triphosphatase